MAAFAAWVADKSRGLGRILLERAPSTPRPTPCSRPWPASTSRCTAAISRRAWPRSARSARSATTWNGSPTPSCKPASPASARTDEPCGPDATAPHARAAGTSTAAGPAVPHPAAPRTGGLGAVYVARDEELHREVALKEIRDRHAHDPDSRSRFVQEAEITGRLEHPGIIPVYGLGTYADGRPFYAMRFIKGDNLKDAIAHFHEADVAGRDPGERALALRELLGRFVDVCNAMAYAHSRGVLHRDLKPNNILLGPYGETLVVDWGLAKAVGRPEEATAHGRRRRCGPIRPAAGSPTQPGDTPGTPAYMSPEQAAGDLDRLGLAQRRVQPGGDAVLPPDRQAAVRGRDLDVVLGKVRARRVPAAAAGQRGRSTRRSGGDLPEGDGPEAGGPLCLAAGAWPRTSSTGWPTSRSRPAASRSPCGRGRWMRRNRTLVTAAAASAVVASSASRRCWRSRVSSIAT